MYKEDKIENFIEETYGVMEFSKETEDYKRMTPEQEKGIKDLRERMSEAIEEVKNNPTHNPIILDTLAPIIEKEEGFTQGVIETRMLPMNRSHKSLFDYMAQMDTLRWERLHERNLIDEINEMISLPPGTGKSMTLRILEGSGEIKDYDSLDHYVYGKPFSTCVANNVIGKQIIKTFEEFMENIRKSLYQQYRIPTIKSLSPYVKTRSMVRQQGKTDMVMEHVDRSYWL